MSLTEQQLTEVRECALLLLPVSGEDDRQRHDQERLFSHWAPRLVDEITDLRAELGGETADLKMDRQAARVAGDRDRLKAEIARLNRQVEGAEAAVTGQAERIAELEADQRELAVLRRDMGAVQAERDRYAEEAGRARDELTQWRATYGETALVGAQAVLAERDQLRADRANAYAALTEQGRSAVDVSGNLEDGINFDALAKNAEISGLVDVLTDVRGERDRLAEQLAERERLSTSPTRDDLTGLETRCALLHGAAETSLPVKDLAWKAFALIRAHREVTGRVHEEIAATRAYAKQFESLAVDSRTSGNPTRAQRQQGIADELTDRADRFERALNGGDPDA